MSSHFPREFYSKCSNFNWSIHVNYTKLQLSQFSNWTDKNILSIQKEFYMFLFGGLDTLLICPIMCGPNFTRTSNGNLIESICQNLSVVFSFYFWYYFSITHLFNILGPMINWFWKVHLTDTRSPNQKFANLIRIYVGYLGAVSIYKPFSLHVGKDMNEERHKYIIK